MLNDRFRQKIFLAAEYVDELGEMKYYNIIHKKSRLTPANLIYYI